MLENQIELLSSGTSEVCSTIHNARGAGRKKDEHSSLEMIRRAYQRGTEAEERVNKYLQEIISGE